MSKSIAPLDMAFLLTESADSPKHVAALMRFEGARPGAVAEIVAAYRQAKPTPPFNYLLDRPAIGLPRWKEAQRYEPRYHVQHLLLPPGSTDETLFDLVADLTEPVLDRNRPLFRAWFIEEPQPGRFALFLKIHHGLVDGMTAMDRCSRALAPSAGDPIGAPFFAHAEPPKRPRVPKGVLDRLLAMQSTARTQTLALADVSFGLLKKGVSRLIGGALSGSVPFAAPQSLMNEGIRAPRGIAAVALPLARMRAVGKAFGGTLNDVAVAVFDEAVHRYLRELGRDTSKPLVGMLPVSLREAGDTEAKTKVSMLFAPLGAPALAASARLERVIDGIRLAKEDLGKMSKDSAMLYAVSLFGLTELATLLPIRKFTDAGASFILSNVPGAPHALYLNGAKLTALYPISTLGGGIGLNATLASYDGTMFFGIVASSLSLPNLHRLAEHSQAAFDELEREAGKRAPADRGGDSAPKRPAAAGKKPAQHKPQVVAKVAAAQPRAAARARRPAAPAQGRATSSSARRKAT